MKQKNKPYYILGIYTGHTATAALLKDGEIIACASEERFNGIKNYLGFPEKSIKWCLEYTNISADQLSSVALSSLFGSPMHASAETKKSPGVFALFVFYTGVGFIRSMWGRMVYSFPFIRPLGTATYTFATKTMGYYTVKKEKEFIANFLGISTSKIVTFEHHLTHAATAYYASFFNTQKALVLTLDAEGDRLCSTVNVFERKKRKRIAATSREHSLGWMYLYLTKYLGMKPMEHEYKVMGLAPYAKEKDVLKVYEKIKDTIILNPKNRLTFKAKFNTQDTYYYLRKEMEGFRFDNIAGAYQKLLEDRVMEWVKEAIRKTGISTVVFSGGVFMNVKMNQRIIELSEVKKCFFMPSCGDESLPIGACYLAYLSLNKHASIPEIKNIYWGPSFSNDYIGSFLTKGNYFKKYTIKKIEKIEEEIASLLAKGKIVARMSGRMEFGARALGNRSILANPKDNDVVMVINEQMKDRDFWMPFAASMLKERGKDYLINPRKIRSDYMMITFDTTKKAREELKAAMHQYDFTMRPQIVEQSYNPTYYKILKEFEKRTSIGGILNTSFNLHGYPVVLGPKEALYAFEHSGLEYVALENFLISKKK